MAGPVPEATAAATLRVVRGDPTEEELAALVAVLMSAARRTPGDADGAAAGPAAAPRAAWDRGTGGCRPAHSWMRPRPSVITP